MHHLAFISVKFERRRVIFFLWFPFQAEKSDGKCAKNSGRVRARRMLLDKGSSFFNDKRRRDGSHWRDSVRCIATRKSHDTKAQLNQLFRVFLEIDLTGRRQILLDNWPNVIRIRRKLISKQLIGIRANINPHSVPCQALRFIHPVPELVGHAWHFRGIIYARCAR